MKKLFFLLFISLSSYSTFAQLVAKMEIKEPIEGLCNEKEVYALFPMFGDQDEAVCALSDQDILERLNTEVQFLKDNPKYSDKGMIGIIINCKGEVVQCKMDNNTKEPELDKQIEAVFNSLGEWKAGKLYGKEVDSSKLFSFKIKKGKITFD